MDVDLASPLISCFLPLPCVTLPSATLPLPPFNTRHLTHLASRIVAISCHLIAILSSRRCDDTLSLVIIGLFRRSRPIPLQRDASQASRGLQYAHSSSDSNPPVFSQSVPECQRGRFFVCAPSLSTIPCAVPELGPPSPPRRVTWSLGRRPLRNTGQQSQKSELVRVASHPPSPFLNLLFPSGPSTSHHRAPAAEFLSSRKPHHCHQAPEFLITQRFRRPIDFSAVFTPFFFPRAF